MHADFLPTWIFRIKLLIPKFFLSITVVFEVFSYSQCRTGSFRADRRFLWYNSYFSACFHTCLPGCAPRPAALLGPTVPGTGSPGRAGTSSEPVPLLSSDGNHRCLRVNPCFPSPACAVREPRGGPGRGCPRPLHSGSAADTRWIHGRPPPATEPGGLGGDGAEAVTAGPEHPCPVSAGEEGREGSAPPPLPPGRAPAGPPEPPAAVRALRGVRARNQVQPADELGVCKLTRPAPGAG